MVYMFIYKGKGQIFEKGDDITHIREVGRDYIDYLDNKTVIDSYDLISHGYADGDFNYGHHKGHKVFIVDTNNEAARLVFEDDINKAIKKFKLNNYIEKI